MKRTAAILTILSGAVVACVQIQVGGERKTEAGTVKVEKKDEAPSTDTDRKPDRRVRDE